MNELIELTHQAAKMATERKEVLIESKKEASKAIKEFAQASESLGYTESYFQSEMPIVDDQYAYTDPYTGLDIYEICISSECKISETQSAIINPNGRLDREMYSGVSFDLTDEGAVELLRQLPSKLAQHINNQKIFIELAKSLKK